MHKTYRIIISGRVQGVGFRPFVYVLAKTMELEGYVTNNEEGVLIKVSGRDQDIKSFYEHVINTPPPLARIKKHWIKEEELEIYNGFEIKPSKKDDKLNLSLTPDFGMCPACQSEIFDPDNRRYLYPFTTCVNCGPRWAITNTFPFERKNTSLETFVMCAACQHEYEDPTNRRFHSQTNSCNSCGVQLTLENHKGEKLDVEDRSLFRKISDLIKDGKIIAIKNTGGYLLCCDATNKEVIKRLRLLKRRPKKPFAILYPNLALAEQQLSLDPIQKQELSSTERPIVIVSSKDVKGNLALEYLAPHLTQLGIMLPYTGLLELLGKELDQPVVATSGNIHGSPILSKEENARELISGIADYFLHHNLAISNAQDDSVVKFSFKSGQKVMFRRSRGYAPNFFDFHANTNEKILAMGSHLKSTLAMVPNDFLYISQYLGNLDHFDVYQRYVETTKNFIGIFEQEPHVILVDKHPGYLSAQHGQDLAEKYKADIWSIQHHKAHFASVLGEHELFDVKDSVLGVVWDGTGYGDDGQIWGGEFFMYENKHLSRLTHFDYFSWLAGDKMAQEPRISLLSLANEQMEKVLNRKFTKNELNIYESLKKSNKLKTSSVGRLFDAVASLLNICDVNTYEGEAAIMLENSILDFDISHCKVYCLADDQLHISTRELWNNLFEDFKKGVEKEKIILNFLYTLAMLILDIARKRNNKKIALSGGVFQNTILIDILKELSADRFELFFNRNLAPNDENISYGQLMYYLNCMDPDKNG
jgi:hydrogenase maturation protein HypF